MHVYLSFGLKRDSKRWVPSFRKWLSSDIVLSPLPIHMPGLRSRHRKRPEAEAEARLHSLEERVHQESEFANTEAAEFQKCRLWWRNGAARRADEEGAVALAHAQEEGACYDLAEMESQNRHDLLRARSVFESEMQEVVSAGVHAQGPDRALLEQAHATFCWRTGQLQEEIATARREYEAAEQREAASAAKEVGRRAVLLAQLNDARAQLARTRQDLAEGRREHHRLRCCMHHQLLVDEVTLAKQKGLDHIAGRLERKLEEQGIRLDYSRHIWTGPAGKGDMAGKLLFYRNTGNAPLQEEDRRLSDAVASERGSSERGAR